MTRWAGGREVRKAYLREALRSILILWQSCSGVEYCECANHRAPPKGSCRHGTRPRRGRLENSACLRPTHAVGYVKMLLTLQ